MQCQSQLASPSLQAALAIKASILTRNVAWFANRHTIECDEECMEPFEDIDCMTLERFHQNYKNSNGDPKYNIVVLGEWSVDLKNRLKYFTDDPNNTEMHRLVLRGYSHHRERLESRKDSRFTVGSEFDSLTKRPVTDGELNWLG